MRPKILYHGSNKKISLLRPRKPSLDLPTNSMRAVFATSNKELALAMGLTNQPFSLSFLIRHPLQLHFVRGVPKMKYVYLHYLETNGFRKNRNDEYISLHPVRPLKIERYAVSSLHYLWKKSNKKSLEIFLKKRNSSHL